MCEEERKQVAVNNISIPCTQKRLKGKGMGMKKGREREKERVRE